MVFNALKYGFPDSPVRIHLDGSQKEQVVLAVENDGNPVSPSLLPKLFDPLTRADGVEGASDSQVAGANLGLGLYVVREIATAHGGTVEVSSDDSCTRFELRLPRICVRRLAHPLPNKVDRLP
jgi:signal transduction histidine kinase